MQTLLSTPGEAQSGPSGGMTATPDEPPLQQRCTRLRLDLSEYPSLLEKRCRGGPGKKRKGISDEEKRSRQHERVLRNRIAAQESRNKRHMYLDALQAAAVNIDNENRLLREEKELLIKRVKSLEQDNTTLSSKVDWLMQQMTEKKQRQDLFDVLDTRNNIQNNDNTMNIETNESSLFLPLKVFDSLSDNAFPPLSVLNETTLDLNNYESIPTSFKSEQPQLQLFNPFEVSFVESEEYAFASVSPLSTCNIIDYDPTITSPILDFNQFLFDDFSGSAVSDKLIDLSINSQQRRPSKKALYIRLTYRFRLYLTTILHQWLHHSALMTHLFSLCLTLVHIFPLFQTSSRLYDTLMSGMLLSNNRHRVNRLFGCKTLSSSPVRITTHLRRQLKRQAMRYDTMR